MNSKKLISGCVALTIVLSLLIVSSCGANKNTTQSEPVVIRWWHINNDQPSHDLFVAIAREFEQMNSGVSVRVIMLENMEYKPKLKLELAANDPPDIFHSWGGGGLAEQSRAGHVMDITSWVYGPEWKSSINKAALDLYSYEGKLHGFPHDLGAVGFWYNADLLAKAGYTDFPADWPGFLALCDKLKSLDITPVSLGLADRWTVMFWWSYLALRLYGPGLFSDILEGHEPFTQDALIKAGYMMRELYQNGYFPPTALGDDFASQSRHMGDGHAAMQLMGQWALAVQAQNSERRDELSPLMRFAPFPTIPGGRGSRSDVLGGGNGFVIGSKAHPKAIELLEYFTRAENLQRYFDTFPAVPTVAEVTVSSPGLTMVKEYLRDMRSFSLYPDQMFSQDVNNLINEMAARIMLGNSSPEEGCKLIDDALNNRSESTKD